MSPPALDRVVKTCVAKDPEECWQSAGDVVKELKDLLTLAADTTNPHAQYSVAEVHSCWYHASWLCPLHRSVQSRSYRPRLALPMAATNRPADSKSSMGSRSILRPMGRVHRCYRFTATTKASPTREINDGLLAPRFAPSQRGWVLKGFLVSVSPTVLASEGRDGDDRWTSYGLSRRSSRRLNLP